MLANAVLQGLQLVLLDACAYVTPNDLTILASTITT